MVEILFIQILITALFFFTRIKRKLLIQILLFKCFFGSLFLYIVRNSWFRLVFFLVYVGAILILFFYLFSLNPKPIILGVKFKGIIFFLMALFLFSLKIYFFLKKSYFFKNDFREKVYRIFDKGSFIFILQGLLIGLWVITKLNFYNLGSLRLFF